MGGTKIPDKRLSSAVQYLKSFKSAKTVTVGSNKTTAKTVKNIKGGKKYYARVRAFKKAGSKSIIPLGEAVKL